MGWLRTRRLLGGGWGLACLALSLWGQEWEPGTVLHSTPGFLPGEIQCWVSLFSYEPKVEWKCIELNVQRNGWPLH